MIHIIKRVIRAFSEVERRILKGKRGKAGQSTIEFITTFVIVISLLFLFINVTLNAVNGFIIHYVTYVASRAYLVYDGNSYGEYNLVTHDEKALDKAKQVFNGYNLATFMPSIYSSIEVDANHPSDSVQRVFIGIYTTFKQRFSPSAIIGGTSKMDMRSESFLGREPTRYDCLVRTCAAMHYQNGVMCGESGHVTLVDNGC